jgi:hypothetical protein
MKPIDIYIRVSQVNGRDVTGKDGSADVQERECRRKLRDGHVCQVLELP